MIDLDGCGNPECEDSACAPCNEYNFRLGRYAQWRRENDPDPAETARLVRLGKEIVNRILVERFPAPPAEAEE